MEPLHLAPNTLRSFYRGAGRIAGFRHDDRVPVEDAEDWIGATTSRFGSAGSGLTRLPDGRLLADSFATDGARWFGADYLEAYGAVGALLVKLLDAGQRLPLHVHPQRAFAQRHLDSAFGKSEAWLVLAAEPGASAHLGFARDVGADELVDLLERQDVAAMLAACHELPVRSGDVLYCPGGLPHAIGEGMLILELQEMSDLSIMLEWDGFDLDPAASFLRRPRDLVLQAVDRRGLSPAEVEALRGPRLLPRAELTAAVRGLLPAAARPLFTAEQAGDGAVLDARFSVVVGLEGAGVLSGDAGVTPVAAGEVLLLPHAYGSTRVEGDISLVRVFPA